MFIFLNHLRKLSGKNQCCGVKNSIHRARARRSCTDIIMCDAACLRPADMMRNFPMRYSMLVVAVSYKRTLSFSSGSFTYLWFDGYMLNAAMHYTI
jgi:hypothetical protein